MCALRGSRRAFNLYSDQRQLSCQSSIVAFWGSGTGPGIEKLRDRERDAAVLSGLPPRFATSTRATRDHSQPNPRLGERVQKCRHRVSSWVTAAGDCVACAGGVPKARIASHLFGRRPASQSSVLPRPSSRYFFSLFSAGRSGRRMEADGRASIGPTLHPKTLCGVSHGAHRHTAFRLRRLRRRRDS